MIKITQELERIADALNKRYFEGKLPLSKTIITVQTYNKNKSKGWFWKNKWNDNEGNKLHEINISAEYLNRSGLEIATTMQHQLVHLYCFENGIQDVSRNNKYHNTRFRSEAERHSLIAEQSELLGWILTEPSADFATFVDKLKIKDVFTLSRNTKGRPPPAI